MATIDEIYSWLLASKQGDEAPTALSMGSSDWVLFWNVANDKLEKIEKSKFAGNIATTPEFLGTVSTTGVTTTETEIKDFINATGFTIGVDELKILKLNVYINNILFIKQYLFKANLPDTYGTGNTVIVFSDLFEIESKRFNYNLETTTTIALGDISPETAIEDYINLNNDASWDLQADTIYLFTATISAVAKTYLYVGTQPQLIGLGNNAVTSSDFLLLDTDNEVLTEVFINGYWVDKKGNTDASNIEVGDQIRGNFSASRYIIADVTALPHTTESNLQIYLDIEK